MPRIFISYRRQDSQTITGRIYDRLRSEFGEDAVFKDVHDIHLGDDWRNVLMEEVRASDVILVIVGPRWLSITDDTGQRRLEDSSDFVRLEVVAGLENEGTIVIPLMVGGAMLPPAEDLPDALKPMVYRQSMSVREDPDFHNDMTRLIRELYRQTGEAPVVSPMPDQAARRRGVSLQGAFGGCSFNLAVTVASFTLIFAFVGVFLNQPNEGATSVEPVAQTTSIAAMNTVDAVIATTQLATAMSAVSTSIADEDESGVVATQIANVNTGVETVSGVRETAVPTNAPTTCTVELSRDRAAAVYRLPTLDDEPLTYVMRADFPLTVRAQYIDDLGMRWFLIASDDDLDNGWISETLVDAERECIALPIIYDRDLGR